MDFEWLERSRIFLLPCAWGGGGLKKLIVLPFYLLKLLLSVRSP